MTRVAVCALISASIPLAACDREAGFGGTTTAPAAAAVTATPQLPPDIDTLGKEAVENSRQTLAVLQSMTDEASIRGNMLRYLTLERTNSKLIPRVQTVPPEHQRLLNERYAREMMDNVLKIGQEQRRITSDPRLKPVWDAASRAAVRKL